MNFVPKNIKRIYLIGICGTGMGSLAGLLKELGYEVSGSDFNAYPPMSDALAEQNIPVLTPYQIENIKSAEPDLVIVGNAIVSKNPEAQYLLQSEIPYLSMPQALNHFFLSQKEVIVVSGTHGKTTTTSILAYLLQELGQDPSYMIGGISQNFSKSFHIGKGEYFVIEGDEYDTAFFDKGPKFLHYNPKHVIMTSLEFDHADIYHDLEHLTGSFLKLTKIIPELGSLHYCDAYPTLQKVTKACPAFKRCYGFVSSDWEITNFTPTTQGCEFDLTSNSEHVVHISSPLSGKHNALNIASCFSILNTLKLDLNQAAKALEGFRGIKRRQEILFEDEHMVVMDDFAHHPTAVKETIQAIKERFPNHQLVAVFEPRSNSSMRNIFQDDFTKSFLSADEILLAPVYNPQKVPNGQILNIEKMTNDLRQQGKSAHHLQTTSDIIEYIISKSKKPCVTLIMSNGSFDNIHKKLISAWREIKKQNV